ncbi:right-handed parallel beta-helix repeat-containing protein [Alcanivorax sp. JB21]|nr:right-handed parallel beta-helix repeat-containing protein [Alcanivorax limicola]
MLLLPALLLSALLLTACGGSSSVNGPAPGQPGGGSDSPQPGTSTPYTPRHWLITPGDDATQRALEAFIAAGPGDDIEFAPGYYEMDTGLVLQHGENVTIRGAGRDATVLNFRDANTAEGILVSNTRGVTLRDMSVVDTPGDGIKVKGSDFVNFIDLRMLWSSNDLRVTASNVPASLHWDCPDNYVVSSSNGRYAIYPVESRNILVDNVEAIGASDAGIYVGQSNDVIIRNSRAAFNVAGFEIENTNRADQYDNLAECNTGGFLIFDLPGLSQFGDGTRLFNNVSRNNNLSNFAAGGIVRAVPKGTGALILSYDRIEIFDNVFEDHQTANIIIASYELLGGDGDRRMDLYPEGIQIRNNVLKNAGYNPPLELTLENLQGLSDGEVEFLLPTLVRLKNLGLGAHIVWDGLYDDLDADCPYPVNADGEPVEADEFGKPQFSSADPNPECRHNAFKFDQEGQRLKPDFWLCIEDNEFVSGPLVEALGDLLGPISGLLQPIGQLVSPAHFLNFHGLDLDPTKLRDNDMTPHQCAATLGSTLASLPPVTLAPYTPVAGSEQPPSEAEILAVCEAGEADTINWPALAFNCPDLAHYNLFSDATDPRSTPRGERTLPYDLTTPLFSDYSVKYRTVFLPPGTSARWRDSDDGINETLLFPVGTVISKTFSFPDGNNEAVVETRLLIKRANADGSFNWQGLPYIWETGEDGERQARLALGGGRAAVSWRYNDPHVGTPYVGSTDSYSIPHANQCITCHANDDRERGSAPIGPKVRYLNTPFDYTDLGPRNQLAHWIDQGMLAEAPALTLNGQQIATNVERVGIFNLPGDSGQAANSPADIEHRARAYLESNCAHCHNPAGSASNTGLFLDVQRRVDGAYGICKRPTAAGDGSGGRRFDIVPAKAHDSILTFRMENEDRADARMPPIARSVAHAEGVDLVTRWINQVVERNEAKYPNSESCGGFF